MKKLLICFALFTVALSGCSDDSSSGASTPPADAADGATPVEDAEGEEGPNVRRTGNESGAGGKPIGEGGQEGGDDEDVATGTEGSEEDGESICSPGIAEFECPCAQNIDCLSGFCVEGPEGTICTEACLTDCPDGYSCQGVSNLGPDVVFICVPDALKLCKPCTQDTQCGSSGRCAAFGGGFYCTQECSDGVCGEGYSCVENDVEANGGFAAQCVPTSGSCDCTPDLYGESRPCVRENEIGTCFGTETCEEGSGWSNCTAIEPIEELCNGVDDNCDGLVE